MLSSSSSSSALERQQVRSSHHFRPPSTPPTVEDSYSSSSSSSSSSNGDNDDDDEREFSATSSSGASSADASSSKARKKKRQEAEANRAEVEAIIEKENGAVAVWRRIVLGMLVLTAALVSAATYAFLQREEDENFNRGFEELARTVADRSRYKMQTLKHSFLSLADIQTTVAKKANETWPAVYNPDFGVHVQHMQTVTGMEGVLMAPVVTDRTRATWEEFVRRRGREVLAVSGARASKSDGAAAGDDEEDDDQLEIFPTIFHMQAASSSAASAQAAASDSSDDSSEDGNESSSEEDGDEESSEGDGDESSEEDGVDSPNDGADDSEDGEEDSSEDGEEDDRDGAALVSAVEEDDEQREENVDHGRRATVYEKVEDVNGRRAIQYPLTKNNNIRVRRHASSTTQKQADNDEEEESSSDSAASADEIWAVHGDPIVSEHGPFAPFWQRHPPVTGAITGNYANVNFDMLSGATYRHLARIVNELAEPAVGEMIFDEEEGEGAEGSDSSDDSSGPATHSLMLQPINPDFDDRSSVVGYLAGDVDWNKFFENILVPGQDGIHVVLENTCGQSYTWMVMGPDAVQLGVGDWHATTTAPEKYANLAYAVDDLHSYGDETAARELRACSYRMKLYPTSTLRDAYRTSKAEMYAALISIIFFLMIFTFWYYNRFVQRRNHKIVRTAARSNAIVSSLFPSNVRGRLFQEDHDSTTHTNYNNSEHNNINGSSNHSNKERMMIMNNTWLAAKSGLQSFLAEDHRLRSNGSGGGGGFDPSTSAHTTTTAQDFDRNSVKGVYDSKPIADLFPEATVFFGDLVGFTAWSSVREPSHVFMLLETLYRCFDSVAKRRGIFKVETIGDCYVAVAGLPERRKDHAPAMCKFAAECLRKMGDVVKGLEVTLGPETGDLGMRIGIHSGPVTAGVLRGDRSRFQLFGDTVNTAARMESTGAKNKIQISLDTSEYLMRAGKRHWFVPREEKVMAKGKGVLQTMWLRVPESSECGSHRLSVSDSGTTVSCSMMSDTTEVESEYCDLGGGSIRSIKLSSPKIIRMIDWNAEVLLGLLQQIVARRELSETKVHGRLASLPSESSQQSKHDEGRVPFDEFQEVIALPTLDQNAARQQRAISRVKLPDAVVRQCHDFVANIAAMYRENEFHCFEHASHVTMSVTKLLSRIVAPSDLMDDSEEQREDSCDREQRLNKHTYGIFSDPLTHFAVSFAAMCHDVDHAGVPNSILVAENSKIAEFYKSRSVLEQNSIDVSWELLMEERFNDLRAAIYSTDAERKRFRQLVVNTVLATDIVDKELKALRNARWDKAFADACTSIGSETEAVNRKATIVLEHLIQASDVAHTMQHWHIYQKWNERLFRETWSAFVSGRTEINPADNWYEGEIGFFDLYIIPLAKKLKDCGVFGVSSDEYLIYAQKNRQEWQLRGREIVADMLKRAKAPTRNKQAMLQPGQAWRQPVVRDAVSEETAPTHAKEIDILGGQVLIDKLRLGRAAATNEEWVEEEISIVSDASMAA